MLYLVIIKNNNMNKETAVEWLINELKLNDTIEKENLIIARQIIEQAKAMHKEQMEEMFCEGSKLLECPNELSAKFEFALYYIETFGGDKWSIVLSVKKESQIIIFINGGKRQVIDIYAVAAMYMKAMHRVHGIHYV